MCSINLNYIKICRRYCSLLANSVNPHQSPYLLSDPDPHCLPLSLDISGLKTSVIKGRYAKFPLLILELCVAQTQYKYERSIWVPIGRHGRAVRAPPMLVEHLLRQIISIKIPYTAYLSLVRKCKEQTVQTPIGNTILCSIWICTVCHCHWSLEVFFFFCFFFFCFSHQRNCKTNHQQNYLFDTDRCNAQTQDKSERTTRVPISSNIS